MADKLILNANLIRSADKFVPRKCTVEKVIDVSHEEFQHFIENPTGHNYYLPQYKDLMGIYDGSIHCVLFVDDKTGNGFLVNSGDYDYARYSQYITNAREIIQRHEQTAALDNLKIHMDCCIDRWLKQNENKSKFEIPLTDLIDDSNLAEIFVDYASEMLYGDPRIEYCELTHNSIEVTKRELVETRFYCPLKIEIDDGSEYPEEVCSENYVGYDDEINDFIRADLNRDDNAVERGLAAYFHDDNLDKKVYSIMPMVETRNGNLYGMAVVNSYGELDKAETADLVEYISGQYGDGFGEGLEQRPITLGEDEVYISLWNSDGDYFLKPENEVFQTQNLDQTIGGKVMAENIMNNENTIVVKFRCPMEFVVAPEDVEKDCYEDSASRFADHVDEINKLIRESFGLDGAEECGLAAYLIDDDLAEKITGIIPSVENVDGKLCGAINVTSREPLTEIETGKLKKEMIEQLDNGWGWDFMEDTVRVDGEDVYISFLCAKNGEHIHVLDNTENIEPTMGGLS